ncbi:uncharacterized protein [Vulpes vulpes]|uniref:Ral guanine nucleotide dissociation stimulator-like n=1 Tax=Vulpes vulpes TaxID=9627 RepID=A0ABM5AVG7_VULVU
MPTPSFLWGRCHLAPWLHSKENTPSKEGRKGVPRRVGGLRQADGCVCAGTERGCTATADAAQWGVSRLLGMGLGPPLTSHEPGDEECLYGFRRLKKIHREDCFLEREHRMGCQAPSSCCGHSCPPCPPQPLSSGFGLWSNSQVVWRLQCRLHVPSVPPQAERASALRRNRICPTTPSRRELLEQEVEELVPALLRLDNLSLFEFLNVVEEYGTPEEVLDLLFANAMTSFLTIWLDYYEEDFHDAPEFPALTKLLKFTGQYQCQAQCSTVVRSVTFGVS